jgi:hypothetical protein
VLPSNPRSLQRIEVSDIFLWPAAGSLCQAYVPTVLICEMLGRWLYTISKGVLESALSAQLTVLTHPTRFQSSVHLPPHTDLVSRTIE